MFDWIIEADIYRLTKQLADATDRTTRAKLSRIIDGKRKQLPPPVIEVKMSQRQ